MIRAHNDKDKVIVLHRHHKHTYLKAVGFLLLYNTNFAYLLDIILKPSNIIRTFYILQPMVTERTRFSIPTRYFYFYFYSLFLP